MSLRVFITGTNRGIGLELVRQYLAQGAYVFAGARKPYRGELTLLAEKYHGKCFLIPLDVTSEQELHAAIAAVREQIDGLDLLINNAAVIPKGTRLGTYDRATMLEVLHTNAVAPILIGQAFLDLLRHGTAPKVVNISSQLGSFWWNQNGSFPVYAASKAALNMYTRSFAHEAIGVTTIAVHPGWVQTDGGGKGAPLTAPQSVQQLKTLIARLLPSDNGHFFNYDGQPHPW